MVRESTESTEMLLQVIRNPEAHFPEWNARMLPTMKRSASIPAFGRPIRHDFKPVELRPDLTNEQVATVEQNCHGH